MQRDCRTAVFLLGYFIRLYLIFFGRISLWDAELKPKRNK